MRNKIAKVAFVVVLVVVAVAFAAALPAQADGGNPFTPNDSRVNPMTGDRLAVYCNQNSIDVMGIDEDNNGFNLASFPVAQFNGAAMARTSTSGRVTLRMDPTQLPGFFPANFNFNGTGFNQPTMNTTQGMTNAQGATSSNQGTTNTQGMNSNGLQVVATMPTSFVVTWTGGQFGADGSLPFVKHFACGYAFNLTNFGVSSQSNTQSNSQSNTGASAPASAATPAATAMP